MPKVKDLREYFEFGIVRCSHGDGCSVCCWGWTGGRKKNIPHITIARQQWRVSMVGWRLHYKKKPDGKLTASCYNSACTNPLHWHTSQSEVYISQRFWSKVQRCDHDWTCDLCCWPWLGGINPDGYGNFTYKGHTYGAPRVCWSIYWNGGIIPESVEETRHSCHKPICCNPNHLSIGSHLDNMRDRSLAGRSASKLQSKEVLDIRTLYATGRHSITRLADQYDVSPSRISFILNHKSWLHVEDDLQPKINVLLKAYTGFNSRKKLTPNQVFEIRKFYFKGTYTQKHLSKIYGVSSKQISAIVTGESWVDVDGPLVKKGKRLKGESNGNSRLTISEVEKIKQYSKNGKSTYNLASLFNVSQSTISKIIRGETWGSA